MKASDKNPQTHARLLGMAVALMVLLAGGTGASEIRITGPATPVQPAYFGMHIHRADTTTAWPIARFATWRLWDTGVSWERLEPAQDAWDFRRLDALVNLAQQHGVEPMLTLGITPRWAASRPDEKFVYGNGGNSPPRDMHDWEDYVRTVAMRYKGRIRYFELWNEPTFDEIDKGKGFYAGSARTMVELGRIAHRVIKSVDPDNKLISPGFADEGGRLDLYLSLGGKEITDVVAHHFYPEKPELLPTYVGHVRRVMAKHGLSHLQLWNTETGYWLPASGQKTSSNWPKTEQEVAAFLARVLILGAATGLDRFYWYSWESAMLNHTPNQIQAGRVIRAYMQVRRWLLNSQVESCESGDRQFWVCQLRQGERVSYLVWKTGAPVNWKPPQDWVAKRYEDLSAKVTSINFDSTLMIGLSPILIQTDSEVLQSMPHARQKK
jgi:hypothetical protein